MIALKQIVNFLESVASPKTSESYDNVGLLVGDINQDINQVLIALDLTEEIISEAKEKGCNLIITHHPIIFKGLKRLTGSNLVERCIVKAIKNDIAIYAMHTNLDNYRFGVSHVLAQKLNILEGKPLASQKGVLKKLVVFCPIDHAEKLRKAIFNVGAGSIGNYDQCSFNIEGKGTFRGNETSQPFVGKAGEQHIEEEVRIETVFHKYDQRKIVEAMINAHPYEEVAYDIYPLDNVSDRIGLGIIGELKEEEDTIDFINRVKDTLGLPAIRHSKLIKNKVKTIACCGGSGAFLIDKAKQRNADVYITGDLKYHDFFEADDSIIIVDAGHYETEQFTTELIQDLLVKNFSNFAVRISDHNPNPVHYA